MKRRSESSEVLAPLLWHRAETSPRSVISEVASGTMLVRTDARGRTLWVSPGFTARTGWALDEMRGRTPGSVLQPPDADPHARACMAAAVADGRRCLDVELINQRKDGRRYRVRIDIEPEHDAEGRCIAFIAVQLELGHAADSLPAFDWLQRWYGAVQTDPGTGHFERNLDTGLARWDAGMYRLWDLPSTAPVPGLGSLSDRVVEHDHPAITAALQRSARPGDIGGLYFRLRLPGGRVRHVQSNWVVHAEPDGTRMMRGSLRDVSLTIRLGYEQALQREQLLMAGDAARVGLAREDVRTGFITLNAAGVVLFGLPPDGPPQPIAQLMALIHPDDLPAVRRAREAALSGHSDGGEVVYRVVLPGRATAHVLARRRVLFDADRQASELIAVLVDISAQVQATAREEALASERELALSIAGLGLWRWVVGPPARLHFDARQRAIHGWADTDAEVPLARWLETVHPADRARVQQVWTRIEHEGLHAGHLSYRIRRPDGELRWLQSSFAPSMHEGRPVLLGTTLDVTQRERLMAALRDERSALARSQELAGVGTGWRHLVSGEAEWSAQMYRIIGLDPRTPPSSLRESESLLACGEWARLDAAVQRSRLTGEPYDIEVELRRPDGQPAFVRHTGVVELDDRGERALLRMCVVDVTARVGLQRETAASRDRLQAMFDQALNAIVLVNDAGHVADANPAACELLARPRAALLGCRWSDLVVVPPPALQTGAAAAAAGAAPAAPTGAAESRSSAAAARSGRVALRRGDGRPCMAEFAASDQVQPGLSMWMLIDVSARLRAEERLSKLAARQREEIDELRAEMARDVHDQLGQLLGAIALEADLLHARQGADTDRLRAAAREALAAARDISRALRPAALDLGLVEALRSLATDMSARTDVDIDTDLLDTAPTRPPEVTRACYRIVQEALNNVVRHSGARAARLWLRGSAEALAITVEDPGCGFDAGILDEGPGLGVLGMHERARMLGARLQVISRPGGGTCLALTLRTGESTLGSRP
jgi:PAS domain S-box-containing protein